MKLLIAVLAILLTNTAHSASFPCAKASSHIEKTICTHPPLGKLDEEIAAAFSADKVSLDDIWRPALQRSQREWLALRPPTPAALADNMRKRLKVLQGIHVTLGGLQFLRLSDASRPMFLLGNASGAKAYNQWVEKVWVEGVGETTELPDGTPSCPTGDQDNCNGDTTARIYETVVPSPSIVSVSEKIISYEQMAAHPMVDLHYSNWWVTRAGPVTVTDIFSGESWKPVIAKAARALVKEAFPDIKVESDQINAVTRIDDWSLTKASLVFMIDGEQFNMGRGEWFVEVPWKDFGAALRPEFAAALVVR